MSLEITKLRHQSARFLFFEDFDCKKTNYLLRLFPDNSHQGLFKNMGLLLTKNKTMLLGAKHCGN